MILVCFVCCCFLFCCFFAVVVCLFVVFVCLFFCLFLSLCLYERSWGRWLIYGIEIVLSYVSCTLCASFCGITVPYYLILGSCGLPQV